MNPNDEIQRGRLFKAVEHSYRTLEPFRRLNEALVSEYAGSGYGQPRQQREILINVMNQMVTAYSMGMAANRPRVIVESENVLLTPFARKFQLHVNQLIREIHLEKTIRQWVLDAFFCVGFVKVHLADSGLVEIAPDLWMDPGIPFASNVGLDNWVHDSSATKWSQMQFAGDWYRLPLTDILDNPAFDQEVARELRPTTKYATEQRLDDISQGTLTDHDELEPMVDLCDIWVPRDRKVYTFPLKGGGQFIPIGNVLAVLDLDQDFNPYKKLGFHDVPENIMPSSPSSHIAGLARNANSLARKQFRQAARQKVIHAYTAAAANDAKKIQRHSDGDWVNVENPDEITEIRDGGIDPGNQQFLDWTLATIDRMAGNITAKLGLGAQAPTKGQEELIHGAVDAIEANSASRVLEATTELVRDLGYLLWKDKFRQQAGVLDIPGAPGYHYAADWVPGDREGDFFDYQFGINVSSMPYQSTAQRAARLDATIQKYASLGDLLLQQGGTIDIREAVECDAELHNEPRIRKIIKFAQLPTEPGGAGEGPGMPAATSREYVRRNVSGGQTEAGRQKESQEQWSQLAAQQAA